MIKTERLSRHPSAVDAQDMTNITPRHAYAQSLLWVNSGNHCPILATVPFRPRAVVSDDSLNDKRTKSTKVTGKRSAPLGEIGLRQRLQIS